MDSAHARDSAPFETELRRVDAQLRCGLRHQLAEAARAIHAPLFVAHIRAATDDDAVFALGFVHWQDRAWQMDFQRRVAQGRLSEIVGKPALEQDKFLRTWGFQRAAQSALPALSPQSRKLIAAYTAGVNAAMKQGKTALEFQILRYTREPWSEVDSVSWSKLMAFDLGGMAHAAVRLITDRVDLFSPAP